MTNRRDFLKNASFLTLGGLFAGTAGVSCTQLFPAKKRIGLQIYSLTVGGSTEFTSDIAGGLKRVAQMGYTTLELAGYNTNGNIGAVSMADFKKMADDASLEIVSSHLSPPVRGPYSPENKDEILDFWKKATDQHAAIGVKLIIQPSQPSTRNIEEVAYVSEIFNEAGKVAKAGGLSFGYHNHAGEFQRVSSATPPPETETPAGERPRRGPRGEIIYDLMMKNTDPSLVFFELDVYWCVMGQQDPVEYMRNYADRISVLHIKDKAVLGQSGMMNFEMIYKQAYINEVKEFIVEIESVPGDMTQFEGAKGCADYLLNASFVK